MATMDVRFFGAEFGRDPQPEWHAAPLAIGVMTAAAFSQCIIRNGRGWMNFLAGAFLRERTPTGAAISVPFIAAP
jgi:hypothetical protein